MEDELAVHAKPFLRWAGGKARLVPKLMEYAPRQFHAYHEPFLGGGAFFFALHPRRAYLSDANAELICAYRAVREHSNELIIQLQLHEHAHSKDHYLAVRAQNPLALEPIDRAARMIYLNHTAFNGLYRVNKAGGFNVPWDPGRSGAAEEDVIARANGALTQAHVFAADFRAVEKRAQKDDFVYFDSPYIPLNATSDFTSYTADKFTYLDQVDLRDLALRLKRRSVHVLLSNSGTDAVRDLYRADFNLFPVQARRNINCKGDKRGSVTELIIR